MLLSSYLSLLLGALFILNLVWVGVDERFS